MSHACLSINNFILWNCEWLIKSVIVYLIVPYYLDNRSNSRANTCEKTRLFGRVAFIRYKTNGQQWSPLVIHNNFCGSHGLCAGDESFKFLPYQLSMVRYWPTMVTTGNGELGFGSGEGAWEMATTSKEGSRRANYPILTQGGSDNK